MILVDFIIMFMLVFFTECLIATLVNSFCSNPKDRKMIASFIQVALTTLICLKACGRL